MINRPIHHYAARDDHPHDLVRALENLVNPDVANMIERVLLQIAVPAVQLQRLIAHLERNVGGSALAMAQ